MSGYYFWEPTGAKFFISRGSEWAKELEAQGYVWVECTQ